MTKDDPHKGCLAHFAQRFFDEVPDRNDERFQQVEKILLARLQPITKGRALGLSYVIRFCPDPNEEKTP